MTRLAKRFDVRNLAPVSELLDEPGRTAGIGRRGQRCGEFRKYNPAATTKPFSEGREVVLKQPFGNKTLVNNNGGDHAVNDPQRDLPRVSKGCRGWNRKLRNPAVTAEFVAALLARLVPASFWLTPTTPATPMRQTDGTKRGGGVLERLALNCPRRH